ncbi:MAG: type IX secretion system protein PorQ [Chitinophagales bacterium]|nr:type IX secretion system protein PorQ [Chitinophagales bacterium]
MNQAKYILLLLIALFLSQKTNAQIGGTATFAYLKFPTAARAEALGGGIVPIYNQDNSLAFSNPLLIDSAQHQQIAFSNAFFIDGIKNGNLSYAHYHKKIKTTLLYGVQYVAYGKMESYDMAGNYLGNVKASDINLQVGTAHHWNHLYYGATLKFLISNLAGENAIGIATDIGLAYINQEKNMSACFVFRNAGFQLKQYLKEQSREKLPYQLDFSFSKRFKHLPLTIITTAHNLQTWELRFPYEEQSNNNIFNSNTKNKNTIIDNIFRHVIVGFEIEAGKPVRLRFGYNHLKRRELAPTAKKGFAGINAGLGLNIKQFALDYGFGAYHPAGNDHYLTLRIKLDEFGNKAK